MRTRPPPIHKTLVGGWQEFPRWPPVTSHLSLLYPKTFLTSPSAAQGSQGGGDGPTFCTHLYGEELLHERYSGLSAVGRGAMGCSMAASWL